MLTPLAGMNFERFPHVLDGSKSRTPPSSSNSELTILAGVAYFWQIAIPVVVSTVILFSWLYLLELFNSARRIVLRLVRRCERFSSFLGWEMS